MDKLYWLNPHGPDGAFPDPSLALTEPSGLLAIGGDLSPERLLAAYRQGIFPWYSEGQPILWWSPDPRLVLFPKQLSISRSLRKRLRKRTFDVTLDQAFSKVIGACAKVHGKNEGTWIIPEMEEAYLCLHRMGYAHSVEIWKHNSLVGGLYGVSIGRIFFGESMFSLCTDASKVALTYLCHQLQRWHFPLIDCQVHSAHLQFLGAQPLPRSRFLRYLEQFAHGPSIKGPWHFDHDFEVQL